MKITINVEIGEKAAMAAAYERGSCLAIVGSDVWLYFADCIKCSNLGVYRPGGCVGEKIKRVDIPHGDYHEDVDGDPQTVESASTGIFHRS